MHNKTLLQLLAALLLIAAVAWLALRFLPDSAPLAPAESGLSEPSGLSDPSGAPSDALRPQDGDAFYRQMREAFAAKDAAGVLQGAGALAALQPRSYKAAMHLCLAREYVRAAPPGRFVRPDPPDQADHVGPADQVDQADQQVGQAYRDCYAEAAALCGEPPHDFIRAQDYALLLLLAGDPAAPLAEQAYMSQAPLPDGEYFQELLGYDRVRLLERLLQPLGAMPTM